MSEPVSPPHDDPHQAHPNYALTNSYLANERTFLAWSRTAVSLLGFGVTIAKLGWDLANLRNSPTHGQQALILGGALIAGALVIIVLGFLRFSQTVRDLEQGTVQARGGFAYALAIGGVIGCLVLLAYLWTMATAG